MSRILLPVDGSDSARRAAEYLARLAGDGARLEVHLLNVQIPLSGDIAMFVSGRNIDDWHRENAEEQTRAAVQALEGSSVSLHRHIAVGSVAATIAEHAERLGVDAIVMGTRGLGGVAGLLLGSVASQVVHAVRVPVTLVK